MAARDPGREFVMGLLEDRYGLRLEPILEDEGETADLALIEGGREVLACEVKTLGPPEIKWRRVSEHVSEYFGPDRGAQRIGRIIQKAVHQLARYECPRILAIVNESRLDALDLEAAFSGLLPISAPGLPAFVRQAEAPRVAYGRLLAAKFAIDLYLWIEARRPSVAGNEPVVYMRAMTDRGVLLARERFAAPQDGWGARPTAYPEEGAEETAAGPRPE